MAANDTLSGLPIPHGAKVVAAVKPVERAFG
jgi:hypothetical protein